MNEIGLKRELSVSYDEARARLPEALASEGFGVLTNIDVRATLKQKLGVEFRRYEILGACNPKLAHQALQARLEVGVMLPCNVVLWEDGEGKTVVTAIDPMQTIAAQAGGELAEIARTVREKLARVLDRVAANTP
jgi:uncharacterized protein (DUF302 family)